MGLLGLAARALCNLTAFVYPTYATYKALSPSPSPPSSSSSSREQQQQQQPHEQQERWLKYWAVLGLWTAFEGVFGWLLAWVPFFSVVKLGAAVWMVAPQSEGSTYIYTAHLAPLLAAHEAALDGLLADARAVLGRCAAGGVKWGWALAREKLNLGAFLPEQPPAALASRPPSGRSSPPPGGPGIPSSLHAPASRQRPQQQQQQQQQQPAQALAYAAGLVGQYAPALLAAAGQARFGAGAGGEQHPEGRGLERPRSSGPSEADHRRGSSAGFFSSVLPGSNASNSSSGSSSSSGQSRARRRAELHAQLAALDSPPASLPSARPSAHPTSHASGSSSSSSSSGRGTPRPGPGADELGRSGYDEIRADEAAEYGAPARAGGRAGAAAGGGKGWFGWSSPARAGYERVGKDA